MSFVVRQPLEDGVDGGDRAAAQALVDEADVRALAHRRLDRRPRVQRLAADLQARRLERHPDPDARRRVRRGEQHAHAASAHGSITTISVPSCGCDRTRSCAPICSARSRMPVEPVSPGLLVQQRPDRSRRRRLRSARRSSGPSASSRRICRACPCRAAFVTASPTIRINASRSGADSSRPSTQRDFTHPPQRPAASSATRVSAAPSGSSVGRTSAAMTSRDSSSARRGGVRDLCGVGGAAVALAERPRLLHDEREVLRDAVVDLAREPAALLHRGCLLELALGEADLLDAADEQRHEEPEPQHVARVEVLGVQRREEEVVQPREGAERRADREPQRQRIARARGPAARSRSPPRRRAP